MKHLIDKDALVAEIKRISCENPMDNSWYVDTEELLDFINTIEVKLKVEEEPVSEDLEKTAELYTLDDSIKPWRNLTKEAFKAGAKWQIAKGESVAKDLSEYINELSKQFPEVSFAKLSRIAVRVSRWQRNQDVKNKLPKVISRTDLDEYAYQCAYDMSNDWMIDNPTWNDVEDACKLGAKWQEKQDQSTIELAEDHAMLAGMNKMEEQIMKNLWKPADGDDLPIIDREVIALLDNGKVVFAHRPPEFWDGKDIVTGKVTRYYPKTYGKGGWNIPDVKFWLDVELPKETEL